MKRHHKRLMMYGGGVAALTMAVTLMLLAFEENLVFFHTPSEILAGDLPMDRQIRVGGLVQAGSVEREPRSTLVRFVVTDKQAHLPVEYEGILPDLFREGQGVVAHGRFDADGVFRARQVLARHDETYMPVEAAEALKRAGHPVNTADTTGAY